MVWFGSTAFNRRRRTFSLTSRIWERTTGSRRFSRGSVAVRSSCGIEERIVAMDLVDVLGRRRKVCLVRTIERIEPHKCSIIAIACWASINAMFPDRSDEGVGGKCSDVHIPAVACQALC